MTRTTTKRSTVRPVRVIASGDLHNDQESRWQECQRVLSWLAEQTEKERPSAFLIPGDVYERLSTREERAFVAAWLQRLAEVCPVVITKGNHDRLQDCALLARLAAPHPIIVEERCGVYRLGSGLVVGAVAWPNRASLAAMLGRPASGEEIDQVAEQEVANVLRGLALEMDKLEGPRVLVGHFMIDGSRVSLGQPPLVGAELRVSLATLGLARAQMTIAGHVHYAQEWEFNGAPILYTGSPFRNTFGEWEPKSFVIAEIGQKGVEWSRVPTPATPMLLLEGQWPGYGVTEMPLLGRTAPTQEEVAGAEVRLRYTVETDAREEAKRGALALRDELLRFGAVSVKVEEVVRTSVRARIPEIVTATTLEEKIRLCWRAKALKVDPERERRIFTKLGLLETKEAS